MPVTKLRLQPDVDLQSSPTLNQARLAKSQLIRFYEGLVQKIGGWTQYSAMSAIGTCRALHGWADLKGNNYLALGTEQRLQVLVSGNPVDVTPIPITTNPAANFSTTAGSATVSITDPHVPSVGDWVNLIVQVSVGGVVLSGLYQVQSVAGNTYTVTAAASATSTVASGGVVPSFTTTTSSPVIGVALPAHGLTAFSSVFQVAVPVTVGGLTLSGIYIVSSVTDANHFTITAAAQATSAATASMNGGMARIGYLLPSGVAINTQLSGFGIVQYGAGLYGVAGTSQSATKIMRVWALDHWGQDLLAAPNGGTIYYWQPGTTVPAAPVSSTAPASVNWILVASEVQILVALGAESGGTQYPLLVRWCDASDFTDWTPSVSNQAGSFQLSSGSTLVGGLASGLSIYLWTDVGPWVMAYQGLPYVFGFTEIARGCGLISSRAVAATAAGIVWLSKEGFFQMSGGAVQPMECPVWDFYNNNVDITQLQAITAAPNAAWHEVSWFFSMVSGGCGYVKWNWLEQAWDYGTLTRTAWIDVSPVGNPMGVDEAGIVQQHEIGPDANGQAIVAYAQTGYFDVQDGDEFVFCDMLMPDFVASQGADIALTVLAQDYPEDIVRTSGPFSVQPNPRSGNTLPVKFVTCNSRGRQIALLMQSSDTGSSWRLGALRYKWRPDGKL